MSSDQVLHPEPTTSFDLYELSALLWKERMKLAIFAAVGLALGIGVSLLLTPIYRAEATVQVRAERAGASTLQALAGQLGPLSAIAGAVLGRDGDDKGVALATLQSRAVVQSYIERRNLLPLLFERKWDEANGRWNRDDPNFVPTAQDGYKKFKEKIFSVTDDNKTGLVIVAAEWKDPQLAAQWVEELIADTNSMLKARAIQESEANLRYLEQQAEKVSIVELRRSLYALMEAEYKKLMVAQNTEDYVLRAIDPVQVPKKKVRPQRARIAALAGALGLLIGIAFVVLRNALRMRRMKLASDGPDM